MVSCTPYFFLMLVGLYICSACKAVKLWFHFELTYISTEHLLLYTCLLYIFECWLHLMVFGGFFLKLIFFYLLKPWALLFWGAAKLIASAFFQIFLLKITRVFLFDLVPVLFFYIISHLILILQDFFFYFGLN